MMGAWLAALLWIFEQWGAGYVLPSDVEESDSRAWRA